ELCAAANRAVGNRWDAAALEVHGAIDLKVCDAPVVVADDGGAARRLVPGETVAVRASAAARVRYLAIAGGVDVPVALGGRGTLPVAALGGLDGRPLARGDLVPVGDAPLAAPAASPRLDLDGPVHVVPGPDEDRFAGGLDVLCAG